ncbi:MAG TPA: hypothetical protein PKD12_12285 [Nitrospira sp.]|nr:hypothetical protein [Nitrospira sp.]
MSDSQEPSTLTAHPTSDGLEEIQKVLLRAERDRLDRLEKRLRDSVIDSPAVANVLPNAICQRAKQDQQLEKSLAPLIGKVFVRGIKGSPKLIADAISPVMMPAIRKAIETAVQGMAQSVNRTLDHSGLSWRGMTWRWEAWKTGRPFGEIVLSHTMKYRVERVFLFYRENGTQLCNVDGPGIQPFDPGHEDLVTGMFSRIKTAVQKFAQDEFQAAQHASMNEFKMDDGKMVLIEQGSKAVLAAVVLGLPLPSLRTALQDALDTIHLELNEALQNFRGDKKPFEAARPHLETCLLHEESDSSNKQGSANGGVSPAQVALLALLVGALAWWGITTYLEWRREVDEKQRWAEFQDEAREKHGIHITSIDATYGKDGKTIVYGLRDPLSDDPQKIAQEVGLSTDAIDFQLEPYLSLQPELVARRAKDILHAPESVRLSVQNGTTVLNITGTAPYAWIAQFRRASPTIPGVTSIQDAGLQDEDRLRLAELVQEIEASYLDFEVGSASLTAEPGAVLQVLLQTLHKCDELAQQLGNRIQVEIHGNTSDEGSAELNRRLALARARGIMSILNVEQLTTINFRAVAAPVDPSATTGARGTKSLRTRQVSFHVTVNDSASAGPRL